MMNGIELICADDDVLILTFSAIAFIRKTVTSGTTTFEEKDLGKPALFVVFANGTRHLWVTNPGQMEKLWGAYRYWVEGPTGTPLSM